MRGRRRKRGGGGGNKVKNRKRPSCFLPSFPKETTVATSQAKGREEGKEEKHQLQEGGRYF